MPRATLTIGDSPDESLPEYISEEAEVIRGLGGVLHDYGMYWTVTPAEPTLGSLSDDLGGIYDEMAAGLHVLEYGGTVAQANTVWAASFFHWGWHCVDCVDAMTAMRWLHEHLWSP